MVSKKTLQDAAQIMEETAAVIFEGKGLANTHLDVVDPALRRARQAHEHMLKIAKELKGLMPMMVARYPPSLLSDLNAGACYLMGWRIPLCVRVTAVDSQRLTRMRPTLVKGNSHFLIWEWPSRKANRQAPLCKVDGKSHQASAPPQSLPTTMNQPSLIEHSFIGLIVDSVQVCKL